MPEIQLPDGAIRTYERPVSVMEIAADIHPKLAKRALAGEVGGNLVDIDYRIDSDQAVRIVTSEDPSGVEILRHSCAHLLAHAVKTLYPTAQVTIGPIIEDGFYYDFSYASGFGEADLEKIEKPAGISNPKDFRNEVVNFVLRARANNNGKNPSWLSYQKLRDVIEKKMFSNTEDLLPVISFNAKGSEDDQRKHSNFVQRMVSRGYTEKQVRLLSEWYLRVRKAQ